MNVPMVSMVPTVPAPAPAAAVAANVMATANAVMVKQVMVPVSPVVKAGTAANNATSV